MAKDMNTFPVSKGKDGKFFGFADAGQIARSGGKLVLFDADKADKIKVEKLVAQEEAKVKDADDKVKKAEDKGGSDAGAVRKGPATK